MRRGGIKESVTGDHHGITNVLTPRTPRFMQKSELLIPTMMTIFRDLSRDDRSLRKRYELFNNVLTTQPTET